jgi:hypothetical protein
MILPWFGGGPAVWTACMLFFQVVLLAGYAYAHFLTSLSRQRLGLVAHVAFLILAAATLPIHPDAVWKPEDGTRPTWRILALLAANVGLPYFVLSATGPLIQAWFHRVIPDRSPYRLYALSNLGSLGALLTYPFLFEAMMTTDWQGNVWSASFGVFAVLCGCLAWATSRWQAAPIRPNGGRRDEPDDSQSPAPVEHRLGWLLLPSLASVMLLAVTNHVCQDIAVVPFFWVIPLSLYLLSFILCFDRPAWYRRRIMSVLTILCVIALSVVYLDRTIESWLATVNIDVDISAYSRELTFEAAVYMLLLFLVSMICHGELVRLKPPPERLTAFYMMVSAGGALGGIAVALICPQIFPGFFELNLGLVAAFMLAMGILWDDLWMTRLMSSRIAKIAAFCGGFVLLFFVVRAQFETVRSGSVALVRNFYGVLAVRDYHESDSEWHIRELLNGRILHGSEFLASEKRLEPTTYYNPDSGIGISMARFRSDRSRRVGVVGLGAGTMAAYGITGDQYTFYEINPNVAALAVEHFYYLKETLADAQIVFGDARLSMERQPSQAYDVLVLDAFTGDAIPAHLLTREAFEVYLRHLTPGGLIAVHISNRHLDLTPVVGGLAEYYDLSIRRIDYKEDNRISQASSDWILMTRDASFFDDPYVLEKAKGVAGTYRPIPLWTDQFSNLFQIIHD